MGEEVDVRSVDGVPVQVMSANEERRRCTNALRDVCVDSKHAVMTISAFLLRDAAMLARS